MQISYTQLADEMNNILQDRVLVKVSDQGLLICDIDNIALAFIELVDEFRTAELYFTNDVSGYAAALVTKTVAELIPIELPMAALNITKIETIDSMMN